MVDIRTILGRGTSMRVSLRGLLPALDAKETVPQSVLNAVAELYEDVTDTLTEPPAAFIEFTPALFRRDLKLQCSCHDVDSTLPEIVRCRTSARFYAEHSAIAQDILRSVNPREGVRWIGTANQVPSITMHLPTSGVRILTMATTARLLVPSFDTLASKIVTDDEATWIYDAQEYPLIQFLNASLDSSRMLIRPGLAAYLQANVSTPELLGQFTGIQPSRWNLEAPSGTHRLVIARNPSKEHDARKLWVTAGNSPESFNPWLHADIIAA